MELDRLTVKKIIGIITFAVLLYVGAQHLGLVWLAIGKIVSLITPFVLGLSMAFVLNVLMKAVETMVQRILRKKPSVKISRLVRVISLLLSLCVVSGLVLLFFFVVIPEFKSTIELVANNLPDFADRFQRWVTDTMNALPVDSSDLPKIELDWAAIQSKISQWVGQGGFALFSTTVGITANILGGLFNVFLGSVFAIYVLIQKEELGRQVRKLMQAYLSPETTASILRIAGLSNDIFTRFVAGQFLEAIIIGLLCFIGMLILQMPYALVVSAMVGVTALIPVFGALIGTCAGAFLIMMVAPMKALWFILFIIILQQFEGNLIYPKVVGKSIGLPGIWVLTSVTIGGSAFGITGMLIGVPLTSVAYSLLREATNNRIAKGQKIKKTKISKV